MFLRIFGEGVLFFIFSFFNGRRQPERLYQRKIISGAFEDFSSFYACLGLPQSIHISHNLRLQLPP